MIRHRKTVLLKPLFTTPSPVFQWQHPLLRLVCVHPGIPGKLPHVLPRSPPRKCRPLSPCGRSHDGAMLNFERLSSWPDQNQSTQHTKIAFLGTPKYHTPSIPVLLALLILSLLFFSLALPPIPATPYAKMILLLKLAILFVVYSNEFSVVAHPLPTRADSSAAR